MKMESSAYREDIPYDFCALQDKNLIEDSLWASAEKMNDYDLKLEMIYMAQLMTPEYITGDQFIDYTLVKNAFDLVLDRFEKLYEDRRQQFERFNDELVKSASTITARSVNLAIEAYREEEILNDTQFENLASELFVMEHKQPIKPDNDNCPF